MIGKNLNRIGVKKISFLSSLYFNYRLSLFFQIKLQIISTFFRLFGVRLIKGTRPVINKDKSNEVLKSYWGNIWEPYLKKENILTVILNLKKDLDDISCEYIDKIIFLYRIYFGKDKKKLLGKDAWCFEDKKNGLCMKTFLKMRCRRLLKNINYQSRLILICFLINTAWMKLG